jgi:hypothetical protein
VVQGEVRRQRPLAGGACLGACQIEAQGEVHGLPC